MTADTHKFKKYGLNGHNNKCRCEVCVSAARAYSKAYRSLKRGKEWVSAK